MLRLVSEGAVLFLLPFAAYAVLLAAQRRSPFIRALWSNGSLGWMAGAGLALALAGLLALGLLSERHSGGYVPAHIENGQLVPGRMP